MSQSGAISVIRPPGSRDMLKIGGNGNRHLA
jgi:hypothetical protein